MVTPVPGYAMGTPYAARGSYWGCDPDAYGNGKHTGVDYPAPAGAKVVAARPGTVRHVSYGSAFGSHQVAVVAADGTRDFYAHMRQRAGDGARVEAGDKIGEVGSEGNVTGPHLHFERHATTSGGWSCGVIRDPAPSINHKGSDDDMPLNDDDLSAIAKRVNQVLGDYLAGGEPREGYGGKNEPNPEQADRRIRELENIARNIVDRLKTIENKIDKL